MTGLTLRDLSEDAKGKAGGLLTNLVTGSGRVIEKAVLASADGLLIAQENMARNPADALACGARVAGALSAVHALAGSLGVEFGVRSGAGLVWMEFQPDHPLLGGAEARHSGLFITSAGRGTVLVVFADDIGNAEVIGYQVNHFIERVGQAWQTADRQGPAERAERAGRSGGS